MSIKAHVVIEFGNTHVELYRHWGGDIEITGFDILQAIHDAPDYKERGHFHDGGYLLRLLLSQSDGQLPQYQVVDGLLGMDWSHGYLLEFIEDTNPKAETSVTLGDQSITFKNTEAVSAISSCDGDWVISYAELEGWECIDDWRPTAKRMSLEEFGQLVKTATDDAIASGKISDLDIRTELLNKLKRPRS
jgi:hypothetical protein